MVPRGCTEKRRYDLLRAVLIVAAPEADIIQAIARTTAGHPRQSQGRSIAQRGPTC